MIQAIKNKFDDCDFVGSGAVALAHLDGNGTDEAVSTMVHRVQNLAFGYPEGRIELQLIGGYRDQPGGYAEDLFYNIMRKSNDCFTSFFFFIPLLKYSNGPLHVTADGMVRYDKKDEE